ncbi:MAG: hypothetical protein IPN78_10900 [Candidatus Accumulibacter sp.]|nr:hypothetical protein [Candidatus Accumulibacter propinquus]
MKRASLAVLALLLGVLAWSIGFEPGWLQQRQLRLAAPGWAGPPLTIAVAADFHVGAPHAGYPAAPVVREINAAHPDIILLPGDFVIHGVLGGQPVAPESMPANSRCSRHRSASSPSSATTTGGDGERVRKALESVGIRVIDNRALPLPGAEDRLWLAGIGDDMTDHADPGKSFRRRPRRRETAGDHARPANAPSLPPQTLVAFARPHARRPGPVAVFGALITPGRAPREQAWGWIPDVPAATWVTAGIGTSILPIRFNCPGNRRPAPWWKRGTARYWRTRKVTRRRTVRDNNTTR